jgi:hypothetical protein
MGKFTEIMDEINAVSNIKERGEAQVLGSGSTPNAPNIKQVQNRNAQLAGQMLSNGVNPFAISQLALETRIDMLIDVIVGKVGTPNRGAFDLQLELNMQEKMRALISQLKSQSLQVPGQAGGLLIPKH